MNTSTSGGADVALNALPTKERAERLELRARPRRVTRLKRKAVIGAVVILLAVTVLVVAWGLRSPTPRRENDVTPKPDVGHIARAEGLAALPRDYASIHASTNTTETGGATNDVPLLGPPRGELGQPLPMLEGDSREGGNPVRATGRVRRESTEGTAPRGALTSSPFFKLSHRSRENAGDASATSLESAALVLDGNDSAGPVPADPKRERAPGRPRLASIATQYVNSPDSGHSYIYGAPTPPLAHARRSTLFAGTLIRGALLTAIDSDLPGEIVASVVENVFDSVSGRILAIPQGSRLIGEYDSKTSFGQRRLSVVWNRIIRPDGSSLTLDHLKGVDAAGRTGLEDEVDWHTGRLLSGAVASSVLGIGAELAAPQRSSSGGNVISAAKDGIQDSINELGKQITQRNLDLRPTLRIRPGFPVQVLLNEDIIL
jgi:type IV secretory pathway VirB10-like protein